MTIRAAFRTAKLTEPEIQYKWDAAFEALELLPKWNPESKNGNPQTYSKITVRRKKAAKTDKFVMLQTLAMYKRLKRDPYSEMRYKPMQNLNHFLLNMKFCGTRSCIPF